MKVGLFVLLTFFSINVITATSSVGVNAAMITKDVMEAVGDNPFGNFLNWKLTGMCIWEHWTIWGPYYTKTWKVNEYLPDTVISVYKRSGDNPFLFENKVLDPIFKKTGDFIAKQFIGMKPVAGSDGAASHNDGMLQFNEVDIIGDPAASMVSGMFSNMMIPSVATPYMPYYSSLLDSIEWRDPKVDLITHPEDLLINIGYIDHWGTLYPRNGYVDQGGDFKAAGVDALRATDIATITSLGHVATGLTTGSCGQHCTIEPSSEWHVNDFSQAKYQEIYPVENNTAQKIFGVLDPVSGTYQQSQFTEGNGDYVWLMWRHYYGCIQGGGKLVHVFSF